MKKLYVITGIEFSAARKVYDNLCRIYKDLTTIPDISLYKSSAEEATYISYAPLQDFKKVFPSGESDVKLVHVSSDKGDCMCRGIKAESSKENPDFVMLCSTFLRQFIMYSNENLEEVGVDLTVEVDNAYVEAADFIYDYIIQNNK